MPGQGSFIGSFHEALDIEQGSVPSNSDMDRQLYFGSMLNSVENGNMVDYFLSPESANMSVTNATNPTNGNFNGWSFDHASSSGHVANPIGQDAVKADEWALSTDTNTDASLRLHERFETANMNSDENMDINIDCNQAINMQESDLTLTSEQGARMVNNNVQVAEARNFLDTGFEQASSSGVAGCSSNIPGTSGGDIGNMPEDPDIRLGGSLDGRRLSGKRKNIEGVTGQSSTNGSSNCNSQSENNFAQSVRESLGNGLNISPTNSANGLSVPIPVVSPNPRLGITLTVPFDSGHSSVNMAGHAESSHRNFRMRINPAHQHDFSTFLWPPGSSVSHPNIVPTNQPSLHAYSHLPDVRPAASSTSSQTYPNIQYIPNLPQNGHPFTRNGAFRTGSSSNVSLAGERFAALRDEAYPRTFVRGTQDPPVFAPSAGPRILGHDPTNWNLTSSDINALGNVASSRVSSSSAVYPSAPPAWTSHQNLSNQYPIRLSEFARRSFPSNGSARTQSSLQHADRSNPLQDTAPNSGAGNRSQHLQHLRSALLMERQNDGASGVPFSMRLSGRSRIISEICNALEFIRRGDPRIEDVLFLEQSMLLGATDLHDRHRDMRLDVDNMSYEELLALEERIGNVSTGLNEETVMKLLKQRKYSCGVSMENPQDTEPCCVCQEEYIEGEDVGSLDCGHDFHSACIKEWLKHKNLCPICKTTALAT